MVARIPKASPKASGAPGWTIDELARRGNTTTRNVRAFQARALLPPPGLQGRVGYYGERHLERLRTVDGLQRRGFSLAGIGQLLDAWAHERTLRDVLFAGESPHPWTHEAPETLSADALLTELPGLALTPDLFVRLAELGVVLPTPEGFLVPSRRLLKVGAEMFAAGIPIEAALDDLVALRQDMKRVAERFVGVFVRHLRKHVDARDEVSAATQIGEGVRRLRSTAELSVVACFDEAMNEAVRTARERLLLKPPPKSPRKPPPRPRTKSTARKPR